jgi:hypothetical protein
VRDWAESRRNRSVLRKNAIQHRERIFVGVALQSRHIFSLYSVLRVFRDSMCQLKQVREPKQKATAATMTFIIRSTLAR